MRMSAPAGTGGERPMSIRGMFRFADRVDVVLMALGTLGAIGDGCSTNLLLIFASDVMNALGYGRGGGGGAFAATVDFMHEVEKVRRRAGRALPVNLQQVSVPCSSSSSFDAFPGLLFCSRA